MLLAGLSRPPARIQRRVICEAVHIHLGGRVEEAVNQDRMVAADGGGIHRLGHVGLELGLIRHDLHRPPAQHVAWPHQHGVADPRGDGLGLFYGLCGAVLGPLSGFLEVADPLAVKLPFEVVLARARSGALVPPDASNGSAIEPGASVADPFSVRGPAACAKRAKDWAPRV